MEEHQPSKLSGVGSSPICDVEFLYIRRSI